MAKFRQIWSHCLWWTSDRRKLTEETETRRNKKGGKTNAQMYKNTKYRMCRENDRLRDEARILTRKRERETERERLRWARWLKIHSIVERHIYGLKEFRNGRIGNRIIGRLGKRSFRNTIRNKGTQSKRERERESDWQACWYAFKDCNGHLGKWKKIVINSFLF